MHSFAAPARGPQCEYSGRRSFCPGSLLLTNVGVPVAPLGGICGKVRAERLGLVAWRLVLGAELNGYG